MEPQTFLAQSQDSWADFMSSLTEKIGKDLGITFVPFHSSAAADTSAQNEWMYKADAVDGFVIYHTKNGKSVEEKVAGYQEAIDVDVMRQRIIRAVIHLA
jgi:hypothetical protein